MNREIKFRYWDGENMYYPPQDELSPVWYRHEGTHLVQYLQIENGTSRAAREFNGQIMQYTGLKDKNKKEIYEGDICKISDPYDENEKVFTVEYSNGGFSVEWHSMFCGGEADMTTIGWAIDSEFSIEVIGNIYENPNLVNSPSPQTTVTNDTQDKEAKG